MSAWAGAAGAPPHARVTGTARGGRGLVVGSVASGLAVGGHVLAAGTPPGLMSLAGLTAAAVLVAVALSGVRWRLATLLALLLGVQATFHVALASAGHAHAPALTHAAHAGATTDGSGWRMLAAHLVAAALTALLLRRGEDVFWQLASAVTRPARAARLLLGAPATAPRRPDLAGARSTAPLVGRLVDVAPRRGPPAPAAG